MARHFLEMFDWSGKEIREILELSKSMKKNPEKYYDALEHKTLAMLFEKTSTRTRTSFEAGMTQLGGHAIFLDWKATNLKKGALEEETQCISRYADLIMARVFKHETLETMASASSVPVINGLSDRFHPCQALADVMAIEEKKGDIKNVSIGYVGDGANVVNSLIVAVSKLGGKIRVGTPKGFEPDKDAVKLGMDSGALELFNDPVSAVKDVDVVVTDTWVSLGQEAEAEKRMKVFPSFQVNAELVKHAKKDFVFMHCLPAQLGFEVTEDILRGPHSIAIDEAENRMHTEKALMVKLMENKLF